MGCTNINGKRTLPQADNPAIKRYLAIMDLQNPTNVNKRYQHISILLLDREEGVGYRKTCAWQCRLTREEMLQKRQEFWLETRTHGKKQCWAAMRQAVQSDIDDIHIAKTLRKAGLTPLNSSLMMCVDQGMIKYEVPIFCLNEAISYNTKPLAMTNLKNSYAAGPINIKMRCAKFPVDTIINTNTGIVIQQLKEIYKMEASLPAESRVRLFYNGREMQDSAVLGNYNVPPDAVVQVMIANT